MRLPPFRVGVAHGLDDAAFVAVGERQEGVDGVLDRGGVFRQGGGEVDAVDDGRGQGEAHGLELIGVRGRV